MDNFTDANIATYNSHLYRTRDISKIIIWKREEFKEYWKRMKINDEITSNAKIQHREEHTTELINMFNDFINIDISRIISSYLTIDDLCNVCN